MIITKDFDSIMVCDKDHNLCSLNCPYLKPCNYCNDKCLRFKIDLLNSDKYGVWDRCSECLRYYIKDK